MKCWFLLFSICSHLHQNERFVTKFSLYCLSFKNKTSKKGAKKSAYFLYLIQCCRICYLWCHFVRVGIQPRTVAEIALTWPQTCVTYGLSTVLLLNFLITTACSTLLYLFSHKILFWFGRVLPARIQHLFQYAYPRSKHQLLVLLLPGIPVQWPPALSRVLWSCRLSSVPVSPVVKERTYLFCALGYLKSRRNILILSSVRGSGSGTGASHIRNF